MYKLQVGSTTVGNRKMTVKDRGRVIYVDGVREIKTKYNTCILDKHCYYSGREHTPDCTIKQ